MDTLLHRMASPAAVASLLLLLGVVSTTPATAAGADPIDDLLPLPSAAPHGLGPIALPGLSQTVVGIASVFNSTRPDLFVMTHGRESGLYLFRFLRTDANGVPIFASPIPLASRYPAGRGVIFELQDGAIHSLWLETNALHHAVFDRSAMLFTEVDAVPLVDLANGAQSVAVIGSAKGGLDLVLDVPGDSRPARSPFNNPSSSDWRPYDSAGFSTASIHYRYLVAGHLPTASATRLEDLRQLSPTRRDVLSAMMHISALQLGPRRGRGLIVGSRQGIFEYYPSIDADLHCLVAGDDGAALRHPSIGAGAMAYPSETPGIDDFLGSGEGAIYLYRFTGRFTPRGAPIFRDPVPLLQEDAALYAGTLPTPSVVDWNGDGISDLVVGNSEGFIQFFKNIGSDKFPRFLPGVRVTAGGRDIHHQAGYSGSVQGSGEARWGYVCPNAFDWNEDGRPDLVVGDVTGNIVVYLNRGTLTAPALEVAHPLYCYGLQLRGMWRCRPATARLGNRIALVIPDVDDHLHIYWKIDDYNVEDGGNLRLDDGSLISTTYDPAGGTGRCLLDFFDVDLDGRFDLVAGTGRRGAIPNRTNGYPLPILGQHTLNTPLFIRNVGTNEKPVFANAVPFSHVSNGLVQPGGSHESGVVGTHLGGGVKTNLIVASEAGRLFLLHGDNLTQMTRAEAARYRDKPNPFPASAPRSRAAASADAIR